MVEQFKKVADQGELRFTRIDEIPAKLGKPEQPVNGKLIVGHSETGHNHVIEAEGNTLIRVSELLAYLNIKVATEVTHERGFDQHRPVALQPGMYEVRTGREFDPFAEIIRASSD